MSSGQCNGIAAPLPGDRQHPLPSVWAEGDAVSTRCGLQRSEHSGLVRFAIVVGQVCQTLLFDHPPRVSSLINRVMILYTRVPLVYGLELRFCAPDEPHRVVSPRRDGLGCKRWRGAGGLPHQMKPAQYRCGCAGRRLGDDPMTRWEQSCAGERVTTWEQAVTMDGIQRPVRRVLRLIELTLDGWVRRT